MIPDPNLSFSLTELKNDRFRDILPFKMVIFDTAKPNPRLLANFSSRTRNVLLPYPLFFVVCRQIDICRKFHTPALVIRLVDTHPGNFRLERGSKNPEGGYKRKL